MTVFILLALITYPDSPVPLNATGIAVFSNPVLCLAAADEAEKLPPPAGHKAEYLCIPHDVEGPVEIPEEDSGLVG